MDYLLARDGRFFACPRAEENRLTLNFVGVYGNNNNIHESVVGQSVD